MDEPQDTPGPDHDYGYLERPRGGNGKFNRSADTAERDAEAARMRTRGHTYEAIARELGYADRSAAFKGVERAMRFIVAEPAEQVRKMDLERLDEVYRVAVAILKAEHIAHSGGKIVTMWDPDMEMEIPVRDPGPNLAAMDRIHRNIERRAKTLGYEAPAKIQMMTLEQVQAEIARLEAEQEAAGAEYDDPDEP